MDEQFQPDLPDLLFKHRAVRVSDLVLGTAELGCLFRNVSEEDSKDTIQTALNLGFRSIDTAPLYGAGLSEKRVGAHVRPVQDVEVTTKCGRLIRHKGEAQKRGETPEDLNVFFTDAYHNDVVIPDYRASAVREAFDQSCKRLGRDKIDVFRLHDCETESRFETAETSGVISEMLKLRKEGLVKEIGLGTNSADFALRFLRNYPAGTFDSLMLAGCWNLVDQDGLDVFLECQRLGVRVVNVGIFASGVLWGRDTYKYGCVPVGVREKVDKWKPLADEYGLKLPQLALAFAFLPSVVERIAVGCASADEVTANVDLCGDLLPSGIWLEAKKRGLLAPNVPLPPESDSPGICTQAP